MKTEIEIRDEIAQCVEEMRVIFLSTPSDLFTDTMAMRKSVNSYKEIKHLYWVLNETVPKDIELLRFN